MVDPTQGRAAPKINAPKTNAPLIRGMLNNLNPEKDYNQAAV